MSVLLASLIPSFYRAAVSLQPRDKAGVGRAGNEATPLTLQEKCEH